MRKWQRTRLLYVPNGAPAPTFRNATSAGTSAAGTSLQVNVPAGVVDGDILIFAVCIRGGSGITNLALVGWNALSFSPVNQSTNIQLGVFSRTASSEPANYTASWTGSGNAVAAIYAARIATAVDISGAQANTSSTNVVAPSVTTTTAPTLLVFIGAMSAGSTFTPPGTMQERIDAQSTAGATNCAIEIAEETLGAAGATGTRTAVSVSTGGNIGALVAIK